MSQNSINVLDEELGLGDLQGLDNLPGLKELGSDTNWTPKGTHFTDSQEKTKDFQHVAKVWQDQCLTFDQAKEKLATDQQVIEDIMAPIKDWKPIVNTGGQFAIQYKDGREFVPTPHTLKLMSIEGRLSTWGSNALIEPVRHNTKIDKTTGEKVIVYNRDIRDAELLKHAFEVHLWQKDRYNQDRPRLWRTWKNGTLRAYLSDKYAIINNGWFLDVLSKLIPGGLVSHWKSNPDELYGNILIPDTIRTEEDSDFGGLLSISNSEIGTRRLGTTPSVFKAICCNGCIWEMEKGVSISKVHRGEIDYNILNKMIEVNLIKQIPLLNLGIDKLLNTKQFIFDTTSTVQQIIASVAQSLKLIKRDALGSLRCFNQNNNTKTLYGIIDAMTRFGQTLSPDNWVNMDMMAGQLLSIDNSKWTKINTTAKDFDDKDLVNIYGPQYGISV